MAYNALVFLLWPLYILPKNTAVPYAASKPGNSAGYQTKEKSYCNKSLENIRGRCPESIVHWKLETHGFLETDIFETYVPTYV
jgi:hypothetical protein